MDQAAPANQGLLRNERQCCEDQIWIAVAIYVLIAIIKKRHAMEPSLFQILQILSVTLFEKVPILQAFGEVEPQDKFSDFSNQLNLLDL